MVRALGGAQENKPAASAFYLKPSAYSTAMRHHEQRMAVWAAYLAHALFCLDLPWSLLCDSLFGGARSVFA